MAKAEKTKTKSKEDVKNQFSVIRRAGVPLCAIETADPWSTIHGIKKLLGDEADSTPTFLWDMALSVRFYNKAAKALDLGDPAALSNPVECLSTLHAKIVDEKNDSPWCGMIFFVLNAHRIIDGQGVSQAIWNLREALKSIGGVLILLAPALTLPVELKHDVVVITEPLPGADELWGITKSVAKEADLGDDIVPESSKARVSDILRGLSGFAAEQVVAMSLSKSGIDETVLWERKRRMIEQTPGLQVWKGGETFEQLGGLNNLKKFLTGLLTSEKTPVRAIMFID